MVCWVRFGLIFLILKCLNTTRPGNRGNMIYEGQLIIIPNEVSLLGARDKESVLMEMLLV